METLDELLERVPALAACRADMTSAADALIACAKEGKTVFVGGNGGSSADAGHIAGELLKSFAMPRPVPACEQERWRRDGGETGAFLAAHLQQGISAVALGHDPAYVSAMANDVCWRSVLAQELYARAAAGDVFLGLTTSGNSENVVAAACLARLQGLTVLGLTGGSGGALTAFCDVCIRVSASSTPRVQELHQCVYHWLCAAVERACYG
jgi:D-sedoheptulose 7-phosphate isomerase